MESAYTCSDVHYHMQYILLYQSLPSAADLRERAFQCLNVAIYKCNYNTTHWIDTEVPKTFISELGRRGNGGLHSVLSQRNSSC